MAPTWQKSSKNLTCCSTEMFQEPRCMLSKVSEGCTPISKKVKAAQRASVIFQAVLLRALLDRRLPEILASEKRS